MIPGAADGSSEGTDGWSGGDPADLTAWTLVRSYHAVARIFYGALAEHGMTPPQFGVLVHLSHEPGVSQAALARAVLVTPQAMGEMLQNLAALGWVERLDAPGPGRPRPVSIATAGRAALDRVTPAVLEAVRPPALGLGPAADTELNRLLHAVLGTLSERDPRTA